MNDKILKEAFEQVKREIFPLWDRNSLWKVSDKIEESYMGRCNDDNKIIEINLPRVLDIIELKSLQISLLHICIKMVMRAALTFRLVY